MKLSIPDSSDRREAIFTDRHAFVWAGAGTGKTTILTLRALYWLLHAPLVEGSECAELYTAGDRARRLAAARRAIASQVLLTFTRKAAAEMQARLFTLLDALASRTLEDLHGAYDDDNPLLVELVERVLEGVGALLGLAPPEAHATLQRAARALVELAAELQVSTIHGYTARLLSRYPIEAGLPAGVAFAGEDDSSTTDVASTLVDRWIRHAAIDDEVIEAALGRILGWTGFWEVRTWLCAAYAHPWIIEEARTWRSELGDDDATVDMIAALDELERRFHPDPSWFRINEVHSLVKRLNRRLKAGDRRAWAELGARVVRGYEQYFPKKSVAGCVARMDPKLAALLSRDGLVRAQARGSLQAGFEDAWEAALELMESFVAWSEGAEVRELGLVTFDEMIVLAGKLLDDPSVRKKERERLRVVLVDEFQDTDPAQLRLLSHLLLADEQGNPPVGFFVGDNKQSIYRFRGADLTHIHHFRQRYVEVFGPRVLELKLVTNFRSTAELIDLANRCFASSFKKSEGIQEQFQPLAAARGASGNPAEMVVFDADPKSLNVAAARELAAAETVRTIDAYLAESEEHSYRDVMVLVRANRDVDHLLPRLERAGIPAVSAGTATYLQNPEVLDLLSLLIVLVNPADTIAVAAVLRSPLVCLNDDELLAVRESGGLERVFNPAMPLVTHALPIHARELISNIREVSANRSSMPAREWLWQVSDLVPSVLLYDDEYDVEGRTGVRLEQLLSHLLDVLTRGRTAPLAWLLAQRSRVMHAGERDANLGEDVTVIDDSVDAVRVLTVHKAKGLEAPCTVVFSWSAILAGADVDELKFQPFLTGSFLRDGEIQTFRGIATRFGPLTIETRGLAKAQRVLVEHERAEAMRLAYVAATRAKDRLILVAPLTEQPAHGGLLDELTAEPAAHDAPHSLFGGALSVRLGSSDAARELLELERTRAVVLGEDHASYWQSRLAEADEAADKPVVWSATMAHREEDPAQQDADTAVGAAPEWDDEVNEAGRTLREEAMARGVLVHAYLEHFVTESTFVAEQLSTLAAAEELPISGLAFDEASAILTAFFGRETRDDNGTAHLDRIHRARILGREVPFYLKNNNGQSWTGVMDLVIEEGDRIVSVDYKATPRREVKQSYHTQRELYTEALQRLFPDKEIGFEFFWLWTEAAASI